MNSVKDRILSVDRDDLNGAWNKIWLDVDYEACHFIYVKCMSFCTRMNVKLIIRDEFNE